MEISTDRKSLPASLKLPDLQTYVVQKRIVLDAKSPRQCVGHDEYGGRHTADCDRNEVDETPNYDSG